MSTIQNTPTIIDHTATPPNETLSLHKTRLHDHYKVEIDPTTRGIFTTIPQTLSGLAIGGELATKPAPKDPLHWNTILCEDRDENVYFFVHQHPTNPDQYRCSIAIDGRSQQQVELQTIERLQTADRPFLLDYFGQPYCNDGRK